MKNKKEIKEQIRLLRLQRKAIPRNSAFGDDNHENIDRQVRVLERALAAKDQYEIEEMRDDALEVCGDIEAIVSAWDWACGDLSDDLVEADDLWVKRAIEAAQGREG